MNLAPLIGALPLGLLGIVSAGEPIAPAAVPAPVDESFSCGPRALHQILATSGAADFPHIEVAGVRVPHGGLTLADLAELSVALGMGFQMACRIDPGAGIPVPSVMHWKRGHYSALVGKEGFRYALDDPMMGDGPIWVESTVLDRHGSGFFLVPQGALPSGWTVVSRDDGRKVRGGHLETPKPGSVGPGHKKAKEKMCRRPLPGASKPTGCFGMATWDVALMMASLEVSDTPVGYSPPVGPEIRFNVQYNQRESNQPATLNYANFGPRWNCDWIGSLTFSGTTVTFNRGQGGTEVFTFDTTSQSYKPGYLITRRLVKVSAIRYELLNSDGSKLVFAKPDNAASPSRIFMTEVVDAQGNSATMAYDAGLRLTGVTDAVGRTSTFTYGTGTGSLRVTRITDPFGRFATFDYNGSGRLVRITDVIGLTSEFTYDGGGNLLTLVTGYGTTSFSYGTTDGNWSVEITHPNGDKERVEQRNHATPGVPASDPADAVPQDFANDNLFDHRNTFHWDRKAMHEAPGDCTCARLYRFFRELSSVESPLLHSYKIPGENRVWLRYPGQSPGSVAQAGVMGDAPSVVARVLDDGTTQAFRATFNDLGNPLSSTDPSGREISYTYAANGVDVVQVRRKTGSDSSVRLLSVTYDARHRPLTVTDASGQTTTYTWNARGQMTSSTNALGQTTACNYDPDGFLISVDSPFPGGGDAIAFTYDSVGRVRTLTKPDGDTVTYDYDLLDRITKATFPDATYAETTWQLLHPVSSRDRLGRVTTHAYDALRQLMSVTDPLSRVMRYEWCRCGGLRALTDAMGRRTSWTHDVAGRLTGKVCPDGSTETYGYDLAGRLDSIIDARGQEKVFSYDASNQVTGVLYRNALVPTASVSMEYDRWFDRPVRRVDGGGQTVFAYHPVTTPPSPGAGRLASIDGPLTDDTIAYAYDALGRVASRSIGGVPMTQTYDALGRVVNVANVLGSFAYGYEGTTTRLASIDLPGGWRTLLEYFDGTGDRRLKSLRHLRPDASPLSRHDYTYDAHGRLLSWSQQSDGDPATLFSLGHDAADRLISCNAPGETFAYTYDGADNRLTESVDGSTITATYNPLNEVAMLDSPAPLQERTFAWDAEDRLVAIDYAGTNLRTEFRYDGLGRCVRIVEKDGAAVTDDRHYVWCDFVRCEERAADGSTVLRRFFPQGEEIAGQPFLHFRDHLGSVRDVTDETTVRARYRYDPWGRRTKLSGDVDAARGFTGHFTHVPSGLALAPFRAYDANLGRWLSRDPIGEAGGLNLYAYAANRPALQRDVLGLRSFSISGDSAAAGGFIGSQFGRVEGRWFDRTGEVNRFRDREATLGEDGNLDPADRALGKCMRRDLDAPPGTDYNFDFQRDGDLVVVTRTNPDGTSEVTRFNPEQIAENGYSMEDVWNRLTEDLTEPPDQCDPRSVHGEILAPGP